MRQGPGDKALGFIRLVVEYTFTITSSYTKEIWLESIDETGARRQRLGFHPTSG